MWGNCTQKTENENISLEELGTMEALLKTSLIEKPGFQLAPLSENMGQPRSYSTSGGKEVLSNGWVGFMDKKGGAMVG